MAQNETDGILGWFVNNHVVANLLMFFLIGAGIFRIFTILIEFFPETTLDTITISVEYRGASPEEVEDGVLLPIEDAISGIDGIKRITSRALEGLGVVVVEVEEYAAVSEVLNDVEAEVGRITTFPAETERPIISELRSRYQVLDIIIYGDAPERTLKELARNMEDQLTALDEISLVELVGVRPYEISIEVSEENLRKYQLSFNQIAALTRQGSVDIPGGSIETEAGEILIRTEGQKYTGKEYNDITILARPDGSFIRLADIAEIKDGFEDVDLYSRYNGRSAAIVRVFRVGQQGTLAVANTVKNYIDRKQEEMPEGLSLAIWQDSSALLRDRISLLQRNGLFGLILVMIILSLFLDLRLAFWTTLGIPISFLGAFFLMPIFGVSLNMISLFAFIMSLGLVVDDAIVVGENIFEYRRQGLGHIEAAVKGVKEMAAPVTMAVLTTIAAFAPMLYVVGIVGRIMRVIPIVVISVLAVSLVEALIILPAHLARSKKPSQVRENFITKIQDWISRNLDSFVQNRFSKAVEAAVRWRYITLAVALLIFLTILGFVLGGHINIMFFGRVEGDIVIATLEMPPGTPLTQTERVVKRIEEAAEKLRREFPIPGDEPIVRSVFTTIGQHPSQTGQDPTAADPTVVGEANLAEVSVELVSSEQRDISAEVIMNRWREIIGEVPGVSSLEFTFQQFTPGEDINMELSHDNFDLAVAAMEDLKGILREYTGTSDVADNFQRGKAELELSLTQVGRAAGLTLQDLGSQVRDSFFGQEVERIQRGRDEVRVMVRYPKRMRESIADLRNMRIRLDDGSEMPFEYVAQVQYGRGFSTINRVDRKRVINVTASVDQDVASSGQINAELLNEVLPDLQQRYPGLTYDVAGSEREMEDSFESLRENFVIAIFAIFVLLAVQFRSYLQPIIIMTAIPFGLIGAVIGHFLLGYDITILSMMGIVALSGVVVNDSIIMIDLINHERQRNIALGQALKDSATRRFRPILLTTLTTFFGLTPLLLERSFQARFLIPMAISLAFGVLFATMVTLLLVPSLYMILEDFKSITLGRQTYKK